MGRYISLASIYDKMIEIDYDKWIKFITDMFNKKNAGMKNKKAIELGCGTGNMTYRLIESGINVSAVDLSSDMLCVAEKKIRDKGHRAKFFNQDMTDFQIDGLFDFVFSFCDGYNYLDDEELENSFKNVYAHLNYNGYFVFDLSTGYKFEHEIGNDTYSYVEDDICYIWDNYYENDILSMYITFFVKENEMYRRFEEEHILKAYDVNFIKRSLHDSGFDEIETYDDYTFEKPSENSMRVTFVCKKEEK